jgi:bacterioferritin-associated ferredoxin
MSETKSTCCYCGVGCGVIITADDGHVTNVCGDPAHPANFGRLCTKGATLHLSARHDTRSHHPELRRSRAAQRLRASWGEALDFAAGRFASIIREHGPDAVAFYISGQLLTEDYYVFNKLARALAGTNNIDTNSRLCMSSAVAGYKLTLGADAPPACYEDLDHADLFFVSGSNTAWAHPILFRRIEDARARNPEAKLVVVDPRRTDTAAAADLHLAIRAGTDIALRLAGETRAAPWLREAMLRGAADPGLRGLAAAPLARVPAAAPSRGRVVCNCLDVAEADILRELAATRSLAEVRARLGCGTQCGSCVPELRRYAPACGSAPTVPMTAPMTVRQ